MRKVNRNKGRAWPRTWPFVILAVILLNYNNCSSSKMTYDETPEKMSSSTLDLSSICSQKEEDVFAQGYHQFLKTTCNTCHASGPGKGSFAHPTIATAFPSFQGIGYEKISAMAVSGSHNFPYTGSQNIQRISSLKEQWRTFLIEKQKCGGGSTTTTTAATFTPKFITIKKAIPAVTGTPKTVNINGTQTPIVEYNVVNLSYDLDTDLSALGDFALPETGGATLSLSITGYSTPSGATGYVIEMPKLKTGTKSLKIDGMHVQLNGQPVRYTYTFQHVEKTLYKGTETLLSGGSMLVLGPILSTDQLAITIGGLQVVEMAAPPAPPSVAFSSATATIQQSELGPKTPYKVAVSISGDNTDPVTVALTTVGDEKEATVAKGLMGPGGKNRFNWDYKILSPMSVTFLPGETTKYIEIVFSDDERDDVDKTLTLKLADPFGATLGTNSTIAISIPDYNTTYTGSAPTFEQLMSPGGILEMNCVRCHNSIEKQGGYDMTDYDLMVSKGIIVPGDLTPNNHKMFRRMNPDAPDAGTITPMPLDGFLTQDLTIYVEDWIKAGAKNN